MPPSIVSETNLNNLALILSNVCIWRVEGQTRDGKGLGYLNLQVRIKERQPTLSPKKYMSVSFPSQQISAHVFRIISDVYSMHVGINSFGNSIGV